MKVAVVILNWNGVDLLKKFLPALVQFSPQAELYVIDNASTDTSLAFLEENYPLIHTVPLAENFGFSRGYNEGLQNIEADLYCLLNNDVKVTKNWLVPMIHAFETTEVAIAQPHILDLNKPDHFEYAGAAGGYIDRYGFPFCRGRIFSVCEQNAKQYTATEDCFWASGACFFIRRETFNALGGFDEDFFMHQEEIDLCWRAFNQGDLCQSIGASQVYHLGGGSLRPSPQKTYYNHRNSILMMIKNLPKKQLFTILFKRLVLDGIAAVHYLFKGSPSSFLMVIKAHLYTYYHLGKTLKKRRNQGEKTNYYALKSIAWTFFVLRKSKYSDFK